MSDASTKIDLNRAIELLTKAQIFRIYHRPDGEGFDIEADEAKYCFLIESEEIDADYHITNEFNSKVFEALPKSELLSFEYFSRYSDISFEDFQGIPDTLQILRLQNYKGIDFQKYQRSLKDLIEFSVKNELQENYDWAVQKIDDLELKEEEESGSLNNEELREYLTALECVEYIDRPYYVYGIRIRCYE